LLANHGALTVGRDIYDAYYKMETLEHFAGIIMYARILGGEVGLNSTQIADLLRIRKEVFGKSDLGYLGEGYCGERAMESAVAETGSLDAMREEDFIRTVADAIVRELNRNN